MDKETTKLAIFLLFAALLVFGLTRFSYANSLPGGQVQLTADRQVTTEYQIQRQDRFPSYRSQMIDLCHRLETDYYTPPMGGNSSVDIYRSETGPDTTMYHREYSETSRFSAPADESRTLQLCRQLQTAAPGYESSETRIYKESTVPK